MLTKRPILVFGAASIFALTCFPVLAADVEGSTSGTFINPVGGPGMATTGVGTSTFTYGTGASSDPNKLSFAGVNPFLSPFETPFKVGTLTYFNGATVQGSEATSVTLSLLLNFTTPSLGAVSNSFSLNLVSTPNTGTDEQQADYVYFPSSFGSSTFDIAGTVYTVKLVDFENITGNGFLDSNSTQLHVLEQGTASADLFAEVTSRVPTVPEPSTWAMMMIGFAGLGWFAYRRKTSPDLWAA